MTLRCASLLGPLVVGVASCRAPSEHVDASVTTPTMSAAADATTAAAATVARRSVCEPTVACGVWSPCTWLDVDHVDPSGATVYRTSGSDAGGHGAHFTRARNCFPADAGHRNCSVYCTPTGTGCVDALTSDGTCTGSAPPRQSPFLCDIHGDACDTRP